MAKNETTKAVTARFSMGDYEKLVDKAEREKSAIADVIRNAVHESFYSDKIIMRIDQVNRQMVDSMFTLMSELLELTESEREEALKKVNVRFGDTVVS